jgi:hypothetical protein
MADGDADDIWNDPEDDAAVTTEPRPAGDDEASAGEWEDDDGQHKRTVLIAQIALVVLVLVGVGVVLAVKSGKDDNKDKQSTSQDSNDKTKTTDASGKTVKAKPTWPANIQGRPASLGPQKTKPADVKAGAKPGVYVWSDFEGWHAWVVPGAGVPAKLTGTLTSDADLNRAKPVTDSSTVDMKGALATYAFATDKGITGMDFNPGFYGKRLVFAFNTPEGLLDAKLVHVGGKAVKPDYPLVIQKS